MKLCLLSLSGLLALSLTTACPPSPAAKTAEGVAIRVADDACLALDQQAEPDWIVVACALEGAAGALLGMPDDAGSVQSTRASFARADTARTVLVKVPRKTWESLTRKDGGR